MSAEHKVRKSLDTRDIYIPIAERLGFGKIKGELEDLCFKYLYPEEEKEISLMLDRMAEKHQRFLICKCCNLSIDKKLYLEYNDTRKRIVVKFGGSVYNNTTAI